MDDLAQLMTHQHPQVRQYGQFLAQQMQQEKAREDQQSFLSQEKGLDRQNRMDVVAGQLNQAMMMGLISKEQKDQMMDMQKQQMASTAEHQKGQLGLQQQIAAQTASHNKNTEAIQRMQAENQRMQMEQGKTPPGYRKTADGALEAIPGGPADTKLQGVFNQDTSMLQNSNASFDRLGAVTNELLNHPGLNGITGVRGKVPDVPGTDAANARALLATLKSQIGFGVLQEMRNNSKTGGALGSSYLVKGEFISMPKELRIETMMARMVDQHPTLQRLRQSIEQTEWKVEFERQALVPSVTINTSYWREIGREAVQGGLSIPLPLWYQRQGEVASALGAKRQEEAGLLRARHELGKAVHQHYHDARTTAELIEVFEKGLLKQAQEALRLAQFSFQQGASSLLDVLDAQRVQRQIQMDYAQARYDLAVSLTRLDLAVGGAL
mgnify:CR=1 FL=1